MRRLVGVPASQQEVLPQRGVEDVGVLGGQPDDPADVVAGQVARARSRRGSPNPSYGTNRSRTAARVDLPAPLGPTMPTAPPGRQVEIDAVEHPRSVGVGTGRAPRDRRRWWGPAPSGSGRSGSVTAGRGIHHVEDPGRRAADPVQALGRAPADRRPSRRAASGVRAMTARSGPGQPARSAPPGRRRAGLPTPSGRSTRVMRPGADAGWCERWPWRYRVSSASSREPPGPAAVSVAPNATSSGAPSSRSTTSVLSSPRAAACRASRRSARHRLQPRHAPSRRRGDRPRRPARRREGSTRTGRRSGTPTAGRRRTEGSPAG